MMKSLSVKNIGPIRDAVIDLRRFNFLIGPQCSGKSTVAKVLSTCNWVEKKVVTSMDEKLVGDAGSFTSLMVDFHKMDTYFSGSSEIHYESDFITIDLKGRTALTIKLKEDNDYSRQKICYIPAERNVVTLPELQGFEFGPTNLRSFLFDWFNARELFTTEHKSEILNLGVKYYYDPEAVKFKDRIEHENGETYMMPLGSASSGLQSVIPLYLMVLYYGHEFFSQYSKKQTFEQSLMTRNIEKRLTYEIIKHLYPDSDNVSSALIQETIKRLKDRDPQVVCMMEKYSGILERLTIPRRTVFIVEEPEQNLFPDTQAALLEFMVNICNGERRHELTVTTHSPYILNLLNLMFKRHDAGDNVHAGLDFNDTAVYAVDEGNVIDIKLRNAHLVDPKYLSAPIDRIYEMYDRL